jgi:hypothetical protein
MLKPDKGYRPSASHIVLMLTDGRLQDEIKADKEVVKLNEMGVLTLLLPMGQHPEERRIVELMSNRDQVISTRSWKGLQDRLDALEKKNCPVVQTVRK